MEKFHENSAPNLSNHNDASDSLSKRESRLTLVHSLEIQIFKLGSL